MSYDPGRYVLDENGIPQRCEDLNQWAIAMGDRERNQVAVHEAGALRISTVFLGLDHNFQGGEPILWETMVFRGQEGGEIDRCSGTREDALRMHKAMVARIAQ